MVTDTLTALRMLTGLPGPGPRFDQTFHDSRSIPLTRRFVESEQLLFENEFIAEADKVKSIGDELAGRIHVAVNQNPPNAFLDISSWKNERVRMLMIDVMRFKESSYLRYLERETWLVQSARSNCTTHGAPIHKLEDQIGGRVK